VISSSSSSVTYLRCLPLVRLQHEIISLSGDGVFRTSPYTATLQASLQQCALEDSFTVTFVGSTHAGKSFVIRELMNIRNPLKYARATAPVLCVARRVAWRVTLTTMSVQTAHGWPTSLPGEGGWWHQSQRVLLL
jgi:hypothetical protein